MARKPLSLTTLELMAASDRSLFEHHMSKIGLPVIGRRNNDPTDKHVQLESISALASCITEDVNDNVNLSDYQKTAKRIAEDYGYIVVTEDAGLYDAREIIKNSLSQMRNDPARTLSSGLSLGLQKAAGNPQAEQIIRRMQTIATQFFNAIKKYGIYDQRQGGVTRSRMPSRGEPGFDEYQKVYQYYQQDLYHLWDQLDQLVAPNANAV